MIKKFKPTTPSLRHRIILKSLPSYPSFKKGLKKTSGRNNQGRITSFRKGGGHKKSYRFIDHNHHKGLYSLLEVVRIEYNPFSSSNIMLLRVLNNPKKYFYRLAPNNIEVGSILEGPYFKSISNNFKNSPSSPSNKPQIGELKILKDISIGSYIHDVSLSPHSKGIIARAAGTYCVVLKHFPLTNTTLVSFPTGKKHILSSFCTAIIGQLDNIAHRNTILGKAGAKRWLGIRPKTRGEAMNAVDHPHGGKNHGPGGLNNQPKNRWGKLAKWQPKKKSKLNKFQ